MFLSERSDRDMSSAESAAWWFTAADRLASFSPLPSEALDAYAMGLYDVMDALHDSEGAVEPDLTAVADAYVTTTARIKVLLDEALLPGWELRACDGAHARM